MKKIFYVIFIIFFSVSCGKDDKDLPLNSLPEDTLQGMIGSMPQDVDQATLLKSSKVNFMEIVGDVNTCMDQNI